MKASKKLTFTKLDNESVENILRQLVNQHIIIQMFFTRDIHSLFSHLIIHIEKNSDAQELQQRRWVKKVRIRYQIDVYFIDSVKFHHKFSLGHPFFEFYCQPSAVIYQNEELRDFPIITREWKKYKEKLNAFQERFYHDHDLHHLQVQNLISEGASNSVFTSYARLIEYNLEYLEELYSGNNLNSLDMDERINYMIEYIPEIQKYFVKNSHGKYYLTELFVKAKEATADDDAIYKNEMYAAVGIAEKKIYGLIERRFDELKKLIKKETLQVRKALDQIDEKPKNVILEIAIETILNSAEVEQIYLYHQMPYGEKTTYYFMLIATGASNEKLSLISQSLRSKMNGKYDFVLLSHNRCWIQNNLYQNQSFFTNIIQKKYLVYSSSPYHPEFHLEVPHYPYHADLYFHYISTRDSAFQFFEIFNNPKENYQGLEYLFALFFLSFCRTYIFVKTYYLPNYLSSQSLWQLCLYADSDIRKYQYLIEHFWTDFFPYLDRNMAIHHKLSKLDIEKVTQMNVIVEKLMYELHNLVIEDRLLSDFENEKNL